MDNSRLVSLVCENYRKGDSAKWRAAIAASLVVGQNVPGATAQIAHTLNVHQSHVEYLSDCGRCWLATRHWMRADVRNNLRFAHFACAWRYIKADKMTPGEAAQLLKEAEAEKITADDMADFLRGTYPGVIRQNTGSPVRWIDRLMSHFDDNEEALKHLRALKQLI